MTSMSTALRAYFTRRLDLVTVFSYALLFGLVIVVVATAAVVVAHQFGGQ